MVLPGNNNYGLIGLNNIWKEVNDWAHHNNLNINNDKTKVCLFQNSRYKEGNEDKQGVLNISRAMVTIDKQMKILGVTFTYDLKMWQHVNNMVKACNKLLYAT